jgi:hypothetical protein
MNNSKYCDDNEKTKKVAKNLQKSHECKYCDYVTYKKNDYLKHLATSKHCSRTILNANTEKATKSRTFFCKHCNKEYSARNSKWYHEKQCLDNPNKMNVVTKETYLNEEKISVKELIPYIINSCKVQNEENEKQQKTLMEELLNQNKELMKTVREMTPKIGNNNVVNTTNNNQFNLNVFLNEECKDAIKLSDFVKSLNITVADLEFTKTNGIIEGVSSIIVNNLKGMDVHKRPIHCTDVKRETMYIKNDQWEKDDDCSNIKKFIYLTSCYQTRVIQKWMEEHPGWENNEKMNNEYLTMCKELYKNIENDDVAHKKILKGFIKEVHIDKSNMNVTP